MNRKGKHKIIPSYLLLIGLAFLGQPMQAQRSFGEGWSTQNQEINTFTAQPHSVQVQPTDTFELDRINTFRTHANENPNYGSIKAKLNEAKRKVYGTVLPQFKRGGDSLSIASSFQSNPIQNFTPMDNHMAIGKNGVIVSAVNANFAVYDTSGNRLQYSTFRQLAGDPNLRADMFDPRVVYDQGEDRFVMMILHSSEPNTNRLLLFVSKTSNPLDGWHYLSLSGNINASDYWSDFPHLAVARDHVFISANVFQNPVFGSTTFAQSAIWSIPKSTFYQGQNVQVNVIRDVRTIENRQPFALYPMIDPLEASDESGLFFLSSKSDGGEFLDLLYIEPDGMSYFRRVRCQQYNAPADVFQESSSHMLNSGDCRISGGFLLNDLIHYTFNQQGDQFITEVRYGRIDINNGIVAESAVFTEHEAAYASLAPIVSGKANASVILCYLVSGRRSFPSMNYAFFDSQMDQYAGGRISSGLNAINVIQSNIERWGDYTATVLEPGTDKPSVWMTGSIVNAGGLWENRIARIISGTDTASFIPSEIHVLNFPNPFKQQLHLEIQLASNAHVEVYLYNTAGQNVKTLLVNNLSKGVNRYLYRDLPLEQGLYYLRVLVNGVPKHEAAVIVKE